MFNGFNSLYALASDNLPPHIEDRVFSDDRSFDLDEEKDCLQVINYYLNLDNSEVEIESKSSQPFQNSYRSKHIVATWLIGYSLGKFNKLFERIGGITLHEWCGNIWMFTALVHDYGYFCKQIRKKNSIEDIQHPYYLLSDFTPGFIMSGVLDDFSIKYPEYFTYSYDQIKNYYYYSIDYHKRTNTNVDEEMADHGIVGACIAFRQYCRRYVKERPFPPIHFRNEIKKYEPVMYKAACIVAASHNIFKSSTREDDYYYRIRGLDFLCHDSRFVINENNPLLLLLSIVDTIECCKRFSKSKNSKSYLQSKTVLSNIMVMVNDDEIIVDYAPLARLVSTKSNVMLDDLKKHVNNVVGLNTWTCLKTYKINDFMISIRI